MSKRTTQGFTLIEMLVVMAIIVLLAALLFPTFGKVRNSAREKACISKLHAIQQAVKQHHLDFKRYPRTFTDLQKYLDFQVSGANFTGGMDKFLDPVDLRTSGPALRSSYGGFGQNPSQQEAPMAAAAGADCTDANPTNYAANHPENCPNSTTGTFGTFDPNTIDPNTQPAFQNSMQPLYNWWGYNAAGFAVRRVQSPYFQHVCFVASQCANDGVLPAGIASWNAYPALANKAAPDNTIITHCWFHRKVRGNYDAATASWNPNAGDLVLRLDGGVEFVTLERMTGKWIHQAE